MAGNGNEQPKCQRSFDHRGRKNYCWDVVVKMLCMILGDDSISNIRWWDDKKVKIQEAFTQLEDMISKNALQESCWTEVVKMLRIILGDESISTTTSWELKVMKVVEAIVQLEDPQFGLKLLKKMMTESIGQNTKVKEAFQLIESVLNQSEIFVPNQDYTDEINGLDQTVYMTKEELQSLKEELAQANAICDQKAQSMTEAKTFGKVSGMLNKVSESCCAKMHDILDPINSIQGHFVQIEDEQFILHFHGSKMIDEEKQAEEANFTLTYVGGRLEKLTLQMQKSNQKMVLPPRLNPESSTPMGALGGPSFGVGGFELDSEYFQNLGSLMVELFPNNEILHALGEGSSDGGANQANMKLSQEKTSAVPGPADIQSTILTSLAEVDHKIESNPEMLELKDITDIEAKVQNIMNKLAKAREMLEDRAEVKRLKEEIEKEEVDLNEKKLKLARMQKRPRVM